MSYFSSDSSLSGFEVLRCIFDDRDLFSSTNVCPFQFNRGEKLYCQRTSITNSMTLFFHLYRVQRDGGRGYILTGLVDNLRNHAKFNVLEGAFSCYIPGKIK